MYLLRPQSPKHRPSLIQFFNSFLFSNSVIKIGKQHYLGIDRKRGLLVRPLALSHFIFASKFWIHVYNTVNSISDCKIVANMF